MYIMLESRKTIKMPKILCSHGFNTKPHKTHLETRHFNKQ